MIVQGEAPGSIPSGAHLTLEGNHLEMVGTHVFQGKFVHPLTIPVPNESARKLRETGHQGQWLLRTVSKRTDGWFDLHIEAAGPEETIPDPRDQLGHAPEESRRRLGENKTRTVRISQESHDRLEKLTGSHGTADEKLARLFEIVEGRGNRKAAIAPDPNSPSQTLHEHLKDYPWFLSVGERPRRLIIYTRKQDPMAKKVIPQEWEGLPVTTRNTGTPRTA